MIKESLKMYKYIGTDPINIAHGVQNRNIILIPGNCYIFPEEELKENRIVQMLIKNKFLIEEPFQ